MLELNFPKARQKILNGNSPEVQPGKTLLFVIFFAFMNSNFHLFLLMVIRNLDDTWVGSPKGFVPWFSVLSVCPS